MTRIRMPRLGIQLPEFLPKVVLQRMQCRITRHNRTVEFPFSWMFHEIRAQWIFENVIADTGERITVALLFLQHMIVRLMLEYRGRKPRFEMCAQESHPVTLVGIQTQSHPDQMQVVRHQTISRTKQSLTRGSVQKQFTKRGVKCVLQPPLMAMRNRQRPMHDGIALIILARQAGKIERTVEVGFHHGFVAADVRRLKLIRKVFI